MLHVYMPYRLVQYTVICTAALMLLSRSDTSLASCLHSYTPFVCSYARPYACSPPCLLCSNFAWLAPCCDLSVVISYSSCAVTMYLWLAKQHRHCDLLQLYINYKLKSVAALPWRQMTFKFLNTIVDDLFAFVIKMPWLHRLSVFRDDLVFLVYIYQRWAYRVDKRRPNEFGYAPLPDTCACAWAVLFLFIYLDL